MDDTMLKDLADEYGTPLYVYDGRIIQARCREFKDSFKELPVEVKCCYAVKANSNLAILALVRDEGFGADIVSAGELDAVLKAGFKPGDIVYTSNSKREEDLKAAVEAGVIITVGNKSEIETLKGVGGDKIAFRVNPDVNAKTHPKISTSLRGSKFGLHFENGIAFDSARKALEMGLKVTGIHCHIGSNVTDMSGFKEAAEKMLEFAATLKDDLDVELEFIDLGGGLGVRYNEEKVTTAGEFAEAYRNIITEGVEKLGYKPTFLFEPGRYVVAESGLLLAKVNSVKETPEKTFINVDAGFNDLLRPAMYDAYHGIRVLGKEGESRRYDVAGNLCESGDILGRDRMLPDVEAGDIIVIENSGAYGYSMSSNYNSMPLPAEVLVRDSKVDLIRERQDVQELYVRQKVPEDLL
ncbi:MAG: diaminopimelate decarboxylase [Candidatus Altiarchaeales archaeon]|nr:diaminopimelate decarboxylase [Candidatus Altiarchaeales archaeon]MBD3416608.1 diaminopimelate decarboxylase [Candidatus Altiarchaeales archaeon]